jgi:cobalt-zinc-cadmium efflux system outer membrane protein
LSKAAVSVRFARPVSLAAVGLLCALTAFPQAAQPPVTITLDQAIDLALKFNHNILAVRTTIQQSLDQEVTANLRPNPTLFTDWEYLPVFHAPEGGYLQYLHDSTEGDFGASYLFERGKKRQNRYQNAKDNTAVTRSAVTDSERGLTAQVAQLFVNAQLAQATLDLANQDLKSFQTTVNISEYQYKAGGIAENDYLQIKIQLVQFQQDVENALLAKAQALSDLRQQLGYESVPPDYDITGPFEYKPLTLLLPDLQAKAVVNRPDLREAVQGVTAAKSGYQLAKSYGKQDVTVSANYSHVNAMSAVTFSVSIPLPIFNRNQGEIARTGSVITQAREQQRFVSGQVYTDVRDAWEAVESNERLVKIYESGTVDAAKRSLEISDYAYHHGAIPLLDFLNAERNYRAVELAWRQAVAAYLAALEQLRQATGTRSLP